MNVIALALGYFLLKFFRLLHIRRAMLKSRLFWLVPKLMPQTQRLAPVSHGAFWIFLLRRDKSLLRLLVPEGMQQRHALLKCHLRRASARYREVHRAQLFRCQFIMMAIISRSHARKNRSNK